MPELQSKFFGKVLFNESDLFHFEHGLPGFEAERDYVGIEIPSQHPILYLQSTTSQDFCLITLPVRVCRNDYRLDLTPEERHSLDLHEDKPLELGKEVGCFAIVTVNEHGEPAANLAAPLVVNLANRLSIQSFQAESDYSFQHPLSMCDSAVAAC